MKAENGTYRHHIDGEKPIRPPCVCWRCRGGRIPVQEMAALDRILARELNRWGESERESWLAIYGAHPNHGEAAVLKLRRWMEIDKGAHLTEPVYRPLNVVNAWDLALLRPIPKAESVDVDVEELSTV